MLQTADILIVDDTLTDLCLLTELLEAQGYQPRVAQSGRAAMRSMQMCRPDLVLMDVNLPDAEGYQVVAEMKQDPQIAAVPVIFVSAQDAIEIKIRAFQVGGVDYVTKPYQAEEVLARINLHLAHHQLRQQLAAQNQALQKQEERWQLLVQGTGDGIFDWNVQTKTVSMSAQYCTMLGYSIDELEASHEAWLSLLHPDDRDRVTQAVWAYLNRETDTYRIEYRLRSKQGDYKWVLARGQATWNQAGEPLRMVGIHQDISDRKQAERDLRDRDQRLHKLSEQLPGMVYQYRLYPDGHSCFPYASERIQHIYGVMPTDVRQSAAAVFQILHPEDLAYVFATIQDSAETLRVWHCEYRVIHPERGLLWVEGNAVPESLPDGSTLWHGYIADITERKQAERALAESEYRFQAIFEQAFQFIWLLRPDGILLEANQIALDFADLEPDDVVDKPFWQAHWWTISAETQAQLQQAIAQAAAGEFVRYEVEVLGAAGRTATIDFSLKPIYDDQGNVVLLIPEGRNITDRIQAEKALQESEARNRAILKAIPDLMVRVSKEGYHLDYVRTDAMLDLIGSDIDPIGHHLSEYLAPEQAARHLQAIDQALSEWTLQVYEQTYQHDGERHYEEVRVVPVNDEEVLFIVRDISDRKRIEAALRESEARNQAILTAIPDLMFRVSQTGIYLGYVRTNAMIDLLPSSFDPVGHHLSEYLTPEHAERHLQAVRRALESRTLQVYEQVCEKDNSYSHEEVRVIPVSEDEVLFILRDISDRKQAEALIQQKLEQEQAIAHITEQVHRSLNVTEVFSTAVQMIWKILQCDRALIYRFNPDWSGQILAEAVSQNWTPLISLQHENLALQQSAVSRDRCVIQAMTEGGVVMHDTYLQTSQGNRYSKNYARVVEDIYQQGFEQCYIDFLEQLQARAYIITPIFQGKKLWGLLSVYQNQGTRQWQESDVVIAKQTATQLGIAIQQAELFHQLRRKSEELEVAIEAAEAASQSKSTFLANMSHELRTPLNAILGFAQILHADLSLPDCHQEAVQTIVRSGEHLLSLINSVLDLSKIEAGRIELALSQFQLGDFLRSLQGMLRQRAEAKGLYLSLKATPDLPHTIITDEKKLRQVLLNLLSNAIKFTDIGGVTLEVTMAQPAAAHSAGAEAERARAGSGSPGQANAGMLAGASPMRSSSLADDTSTVQLTFNVTDTGVGIAPEEQSQVFEAFEQTKTGQLAPEGTGLGLTISSRFVKMMGGQIMLCSAPGQGSSFRFTIPVQAIQSVQDMTSDCDRAIPRLSSADTDRRILIVDDSATNRQIVSQILQTAGFQVEEAANGQVALELWQTWRPHLIITDMRMPIMKGQELVQQIRQREATVDPARQTQVIALTAAAFTTDRDEALACGCNDFLSKPIQVALLLDKIGALLQVKYETETATSAESEEQNTELVADDLAVMPLDWVKKLYRSIQLCDDIGVGFLIESVPPEHRHLKTALSYYNSNLDFDLLFDVVTTYLQVEVEPM